MRLVFFDFPCKIVSATNIKCYAKCLLFFGCRDSHEAVFSGYIRKSDKVDKVDKVDKDILRVYLGRRKKIRKREITYIVNGVNKKAAGLNLGKPAIFLFRLSLGQKALGLQPSGNSLLPCVT